MLGTPDKETGRHAVQSENNIIFSQLFAENYWIVSFGVRSKDVRSIFCNPATPRVNLALCHTLNESQHYWPRGLDPALDVTPVDTVGNN
jgi:hypothetical protein